jgi:hypothetical protein
MWSVIGTALVTIGIIVVVSAVIFGVLYIWAKSMSDSVD